MPCSYLGGSNKESVGGLSIILKPDPILKYPYISDIFTKYQDSWVGSNTVVVNKVSFISSILPSSTASLYRELDDTSMV